MTYRRQIAYRKAKWVSRYYTAYRRGEFHKDEAVSRLDQGRRLGAKLLMSAMEAECPDSVIRDIKNILLYLETARTKEQAEALTRQAKAKEWGER